MWLAVLACATSDVVPVLERSAASAFLPAYLAPRTVAPPVNELGPTKPRPSFYGRRPRGQDQLKRRAASVQHSRLVRPQVADRARSRARRRCANQQPFKIRTG